MPQNEDMGQRIRRYLEEDTDLANARNELESKIVELVIGAPNQLDLLGYILTEFEPSVLEANVSATMRALADERPQADVAT